MGGPRPLLKNPENLSEKQRGKLNDITTRHAAWAEGYRLTKTFRDFYQQTDVTAANGFLKGWKVGLRLHHVCLWRPLISAN